jgi:hypothetical protein
MSTEADQIRYNQRITKHAKYMQRLASCSTALGWIYAVLGTIGAVALMFRSETSDTLYATTSHPYGPLGFGLLLAVAVFTVFLLALGAALDAGALAMKRLVEGDDESEEPVRARHTSG